MSGRKLHLISPEPVVEFTQGGRLNDALTQIAQMANAQLTVEYPSSKEPAGTSTPGDDVELPIIYRHQQMGQVRYTPNGDDTPVSQAAGAMAALLEHVLDREVAVGDLAEAMTTSYEELNMLYTLLPNIATKTDEAQIGKVLVDQTTSILNCGRASLLVLDDKRKNLKVLASKGLPPEAQNASIPTSENIASQVLFQEDVLMVNNILQRPDLAKLSVGQYKKDSFAIVRVPLYAQGEAVGVLTATERADADEFSARDRKLLEGLSAMGASALLNCRLHQTVNRQMLDTIKALASVVDAKDHYTHDHSRRVSQLCVAAGKQLGINDAAMCREIELAGLLHDIGKIGITDTILSKTTRLTAQEFDVIKTHSQIGASIVENVQGLEAVAKAILHHHERCDGLGYPHGLDKDSIPIASKLISVADTFDALTSDRLYRKKVSKEKALQEIKKDRGTKLDATVMDAFPAVVDQF